jgi:arsenate reductase
MEPIMAVTSGYCAANPAVSRATTPPPDSDMKRVGKLYGPATMSEVTIYHNPACGTSRNTLGLLRHAGLEPRVIEYLKTPPSREKLKEIAKAMRVPVRALLREKGTPYADLKLGEPHWSEEELLDFMMQHPILINRPIVETPLGTKLCRPSEEALEILPVGKLAPFTKSDGEVVQDDGVRRK